MSILLIILLILSGIVVGFINTLSAGGTTISIALYLAMGIPAQSANAINRVGVLLQNGLAAHMFYRKHLVNYKQLLLYAIPLLIGTAIGALCAVKIDEKIFNICFAVVLLLMIIFLFIDRGKKERSEKPFTIKQYLICFIPLVFTGFYGGFVQTGTGFLLIAVTGTLLGYDLLKTTAAKNTFMFLYTVVALIIFLFRADVAVKYWLYALIHSLGNMIGAYIAAKYAVKKGNKFVRVIIVCVIILTAMNLLGFLDLKAMFGNLLN